MTIIKQRKTTVEDVEVGEEVVSLASSPPVATGYTIKAMLLTALVVQNAATALLLRYTRGGMATTEGLLYDVNNFMLVGELIKFVISCSLEAWTSDGGLIRNLDTFIYQRPWDAVKVSIPALLYLVSNTLYYMAFNHLTAPILQVTSNAKLIATAVVSALVLNRRYSLKQWGCLVAISGGVAMVVSGEQRISSLHKNEQISSLLYNERADVSQDVQLGLVYVFSGCIVSALAGVSFEKFLKQPPLDGQPSPSLWMRNLQLSFFTVIVAGIKSSSSSYSSYTFSPSPFFEGFTPWVWLSEALFAGGGLLVAGVVKYADNVVKGVGIGVSIILSTAGSMILFQTPLTYEFTYGSVVILTAVYLFSNPFCIRIHV
jgi:UDP-sugar transporter A1/2/3